MLITKSVRLDLTPGAIPPRVKVSQYDDESREIVFTLVPGSGSVSDADHAYVCGTKPDGHGFQYDATINNNGTVSVLVVQQMTACSGAVDCEIKLTKTENSHDVVLNSANFILDVEKAALGEDTIVSDTEIPAIIDAAETNAERAEQAAARAVDAATHGPYIGANGHWYVWNNSEGIYVDTQVVAEGEDGVGISSIAKTGTSGLVDTYTITFTNGQTTTFTVTNGEDGTDGVGISAITKTSTSGNVDTYTISYTDGSSGVFTVTNGTDALPTGGTTGQVLVKSSSTLYDASWGDVSSVEMASSAGAIRFGVDGNGNYGYIKVGADTVTPFKNPTGNVNLGTISTNGQVTGQNVEDYATASFTVAVPQPSGNVDFGTITQNGQLSNLNVNDYSTASINIQVPGQVPTGNVNLGTFSSNGTVTGQNVSGYATASFTIAVPSTSHVFGVSWDGSSSPAMTRTDGSANFSNPNPYYAGMSGTPSSPFDGIMPWAGIHKVEYEGAGTVVEIPKFWYKWTKTGATMTLQIANEPTTGFYVSPAHMDRGDGAGERDYVYIGRYHCSTYTTSPRTYRSVSGVTPIYSTRAYARTYIHNSGLSIWQMDFAAWWTINMLYLVEFANWDAQAQIGYGCGNGTSTEYTGSSDAMPYHTGTMQTSRDIYGVGCQYRYIEDWWGNVYDWIDGIYFNGTDVYCIKNPADFSDNTGGTKIGTRQQAGTTKAGYIKEWSISSTTGFEYGVYPSDIDFGSGTFYVCDYYNTYTSGVVMSFGGNYRTNVGQYAGPFCINDNNGGTGTQGCRLMVLP